MRSIWSHTFYSLRENNPNNPIIQQQQLYIYIYILHHLLFLSFTIFYFHSSPSPFFCLFLSHPFLHTTNLLHTKSTVLYIYTYISLVNLHHIYMYSLSKANSIFWETFSSLVEDFVLHHLICCFQERNIIKVDIFICCLIWDLSHPLSDFCFLFSLSPYFLIYGAHTYVYCFIAVHIYLHVCAANRYMFCRFRTSGVCGWRKDCD